MTELTELEKEWNEKTKKERMFNGDVLVSMNQHVEGYEWSHLATNIQERVLCDFSGFDLHGIEWSKEQKMFVRPPAPIGQESE